VAKDGCLFVQLTWQTRFLPKQEFSTAQVSIKRHSVEAPALDLPAFEVTPSTVLEQIPANAVLASGEAFAAAVAEAEGGKNLADAHPQRPGPFFCRRCFRTMNPQAPNLDDLGAHGQARLHDVRDALELGTVHFDEVPEYLGFYDSLRLLRAPHFAELQAKQQTEEQHERLDALKVPPPCACHDLVMRKQLPVDGERIHHGDTYRFRIRVKDRLNWSLWTEFSLPLHVIVPPPRPSLPQRDPHNPVPPPVVEVKLMPPGGAAVAETLLADLVNSSARTESVQLQLAWACFDSRLKEVEYRVLLWTLSPDQRQRMPAKRAIVDGGVGRNALPPLIGTQTIGIGLEQHPVQLDNTGVPIRLGAQEHTLRAGQPLASVAPRAQAQPTVTGSKEFAVQHGRDAPQIIAHVRPYEKQRANTLKYTPKAAATATGDDEPSTKVLSVEANMLILPAEHGYVFGVEAKHYRGTCGNVGDWSMPLFSKLVQFEHAPRHLKVEIDARFGTLMFKGQASTKAHPTHEHVTLEAPAVSFADEHRDLPKAMALTPGGDPWPVNNPSGKYLVRAAGRSVYSERLEADGDAMDTSHLPEQRPHNDDLREATPRGAHPRKILPIP